MRALTWSDVWQYRLREHFLSDPLTGPPTMRLPEVAGRLCGIHAQLASSAELALGLRVAGATREDVRAALWHDRSLVKTYGIRGTLHLLPTAELALWLTALNARTPPREPNRAERDALPHAHRRQLIDAIEAALTGRALTRGELGEEVARRVGQWAAQEVFPAFGGHWPRWQLAIRHAAAEGKLVFGPPRGARITYVRPAEWIAPLASVDPDTALREMTRRFLRAYGPATPQELARWLSTTPRAARDLFTAVGDDLEAVEVDGWHAWALAGAIQPTDGTPRVHLLPRFDDYVVGSHPRRQLIPDTAPAVMQRGTAAPFNVLLVDGRVGGLWEMQVVPGGRRLALRAGPFAPLGASHRAALDEAAERVGEVLGLTADLSVGHVEPRAHM